MAKSSRNTRQSLRTMPVRACDYCGEPPTARVRPARGDSFLVCEQHKAQAIAEFGQGAVGTL